MEEKCIEADKHDDIMMPGFRFHPTDEELVGFYLKRKIQQKPLSIELIKQVDIYKYDPWDLPKLASNGEKEWYFYCPRDRKYRNSARPNRVTGSGFWKATGTDRPIYSSDGTKCIGLKKSLVFYRGRAAKGIKTDWMMHEFRLPSIAEPSPPPKKLLDKALPPHDAWAICRIFKKTNSTAHRALCQSWVSPLLSLDTTTADLFNNGAAHAHYSQYSPENVSCTTENCSSVFPICSNNEGFSSDIPNSYKLPLPVSNGDLCTNLMFSPIDLSNSVLIGSGGAIDFEGSNSQQQQDVRGSAYPGENSSWGNIRSIEFPFSLPETWKSDNNLQWDSVVTCPSEISTTTSAFSTTKCYT